MDDTGARLLQISLLDRLVPSDAYGDYFKGFVLIEGGGALVVLFTTLFRERARSRKEASGNSRSAKQLY
jgi:hypothetical protein